MFETFSHTADLGLRATAATLPELFVEAARGLFSIIVTNREEIADRQEKCIKVPGRKLDELLFDWLSELLYVFETEHLLFRDFEARLTNEGLEAKARGERCDPVRHVLEHEVKAITYHGLTVRETPDGWLAEVIVDI